MSLLIIKNLHRDGLVALTTGGLLCQVFNSVILWACWAAWNAGPPRDDMGIAFLLFFAVLWLAGLACVQVGLVLAQAVVFSRAPLDVQIWARRNWYLLLVPVPFAAASVVAALCIWSVF